MLVPDLFGCNSVILQGSWDEASAPVSMLQVSEHASWSGLLYKRIIDAALEAAGAPADLVQIVTGGGGEGERFMHSSMYLALMDVSSQAGSVRYLQEYF